MKYNGNRFSVYESEEKTVLGLLDELGSQVNHITDNFKNKTDLYGDHKGSWQGLSKPTLSEEGMRATVEDIVDNKIPSIETSLDNIVKYIPKENVNIAQQINEILLAKKEITLSTNTTYIIDDSIVIPSQCKINGNGATIKIKDGVNKPIIVCDGWNGKGATREIIIEDLRLIGNGLSENSGIILHTYYSTIKNVVIYNVGKDGIRISEVDKNNKYASGNLVENRIENIRLTDCGGYGVFCGSDNNNKVTDGFIKDMLSFNSGKPHLFIGSLAGWKVDGVHTYGSTPMSAIALNNWYNSNVSNIYIESFTDVGLTLSSVQQNIALNNIDIICNSSDSKAIEVYLSSLKSYADVLINNLKINGGGTNVTGVYGAWGVNVRLSNYSVADSLINFSLVKGDGNNKFIYNDISPSSSTYATKEGFKFPIYKSASYVNGGTKELRVPCSISDGYSKNFDINFNGTTWGETPLVNVVIEKCMVSRKGTSYYLGKTTLSGSSITTLAYDKSSSEIVITIALNSSTTGKLDVILYP